MVFEGRNREYGAYTLRKSNDRRLMRSFSYAILFFLLILSVYPLKNLLHPKIYDSYGYQVVNVDLKYDPSVKFDMKSSIGSSSAASVVPQKIVDDADAIASQTEVKQPGTGKSDSTNTNNNGTATSGTGNSDKAGDGNAGEIFGSADVNPQFPGGPKAMQEFINTNIHYPEVALNLNARGTILVYVVVMDDGSLRDVKIVRGIQPDLDAEVVRLVNMMPLWKPARRQGTPVNVRCTLPITVSSKMGKM